MVSVTVSAAVDQFLAYAAAVVAPATLAAYRVHLTRLSRQFSNLKLEELTPAALRKWSASWHRLQAARRLCRWATYEARLVSSDPAAGLSIGSVGRRRRTLTPAESARLIRGAQGAARRFAIALRETIARPHELRLVTWRQVFVAGLVAADDQEMLAGRAFFALDRFKGRDRRRDGLSVRVIPITPRLGRLLVRLRHRTPEGHGHVFVNTRRRPWTVNAVRCVFRRLRVRAGLVADHRGENVVAYTLRHTSATAAIVAGVPVAELAGAMGHADIRMTSRYLHFAPSFLASVVRSLVRRGPRNRALTHDAYQND